MLLLEITTYIVLAVQRYRHRINQLVTNANQLIIISARQLLSFRSSELHFWFGRPPVGSASDQRHVDKDHVDARSTHGRRRRRR